MLSESRAMSQHERPSCTIERVMRSALTRLNGLQSDENELEKGMIPEIVTRSTGDLSTSVGIVMVSTPARQHDIVHLACCAPILPAVS